jgi:hypothetical protein
MRQECRFQLCGRNQGHIGLTGVIAEATRLTSRWPTDHRWKCPLMGEKQSGHVCVRNDASDPERSCAVWLRCAALVNTKPKWRGVVTSAVTSARSPSRSATRASARSL